MPSESNTQNGPVTNGGVGPEQLLSLSKERTQQMLHLQKELLETYEQASRAWLARVKSEVDLWSELARKLTESRTAPEVLDAYQHCVSQRMRLAAEDGRRLSEDCQKIVSTVAHSMAPGAQVASM